MSEIKNTLPFSGDYYPEKMINEIEENLSHGKARMEAIRYGIQQADEHHDLPYQIFFRIMACRESTFYGDSMDCLIIFPELLALADQDPQLPGNPNYTFTYEIEHVMWVYKWVLEDCVDYYQISMEDCRNFLEDYRKRCVSMGISLRNYYGSMYSFYWQIDQAQAAEYFHQFEKMPRDRHSDCKACERNMEIRFYLDQNDFQKAQRLSREIENFSLICGGESRKSAWLRMNVSYMHYYMKQKDYEKAETFCRLVERHMNGEAEYECWDDFLACYAHTNMGKALKLYKEHWKEWLKLRSPLEQLEAEENICIFFRELGNVRKGKTVKIHYDPSFPLYREDGTYRIKELFDFYYQRVWQTAEKFDARNGSDYYKQELEEIFHENV